MSAVEFPPPILAELTPKSADFFPNWPNLAQVSAQKTNHGLNFGQLGRFWTKVSGGK
jgi:hypothetical protein